jgi:ATP-binding cassette subfamily C (CFTR/MRP) protein 4
MDTVIRDMTFEFSKNEKIAIIGKVGCGKTSLLLTLLKELCIVKGSIKVNSRDLSYSEQNPLIMTGTVRSNILFGLAYNPKWYNKVVDSCALLEDFERMPKGDMTKLGEMGT